MATLSPRANITIPLEKCWAAGLPDYLLIPKNINYGIVGLDSDRKTDMQALKTCCSPNPVNIIDGCYPWCELPSKSGNVSVLNGMNLGEAWVSCLRGQFALHKTAYLQIYDFKLSNAGRSNTGRTTSSRLQRVAAGFVVVALLM